ncbi:group 1 glycosyl transferase [Fictibacillus macauensis ZFHKF-1]|uniref:Group 1 glycosyl transferase n=1 Tax=Fictibacillus macauensis ZFHKF-1 TaxID=1196324 RepID=I8J449_9BACL|nr:glycosyltransferase [Fictibacillus macauensis]EIT86541.1 group 1 glycosyl transferase [Fictibacillus macauensis ZFHKF-1]
MKRVVFMISSMRIGGVEKSLLSLLSTLSPQDYDVTIMMLEKQGELLGELPSWVKVVETDWYSTIKPVITDPPQVSLKRYLKKGKIVAAIEFVATYLWSKYKNDRYAFYKQVMKKVPYVKDSYDIAISYQGPTDLLDFYVGHRMKAQHKIAWVHFDVQKHAINEQLYEKLYQQFQRIYIVSKEAKMQLEQKVPSTVGKTEVKLNHIAKDEIIRQAQEVITFDYEFEGFKIVTVGRLSYEKGQDLGISVLKRLKTAGYKVRWYCVGEGDARALYEQQIKEHSLEDDFILVGAKKNPYPYIAQSDLYVQTSRHEGYCLTLAEARCLHKTIVTTDFSGAREQLEHEPYATILPFDETAMYEEIKAILTDQQVDMKHLNNKRGTHV